MNREIKFRAFAESENIMMDAKTIQEIVCLESMSVNSAHRLKFMQFTGSLDKKGKEIFEGDILKDINFSYKYEVVYHDNSFVLKSNIGLTPLFETENYEVIGNIFEKAIP